MAIWPQKRMDELCEITSSKRIFAADYVSEGVPFYRGREITEKYKGNLDVSTELFITEEKFREIERKFGAPKPGDLLLTSVGTLGSVYVVKHGDRFYFKDGNLTWFRNFKNLHSNFLYYWIGSPQGKAELQKCTIGSSQSAYTIVLLKGMELSLPPLSTQRRIAGILSAYDELIENSQRRIKILEAMARALYREWFVHFRFPGHESVPRVQSALGEIPQGWEVKKLGEVANTLRGRSYRSADLAEEGGLPFLNLKCLDRDGGFRRSGLKRYTGEFKDIHIAKKGDIVMAVTDMTQERRIVARAALVPTLDNEFGIFSMDLVRIEPKSGFPKAFLYSFLRYSSFADEVKQHANGANVLHLSPDRITDYRFAAPPTELMNRFESFVAAVVEKIDTLANKTDNLRRTRDLLLPRLLSGPIEVETIPQEVSA
jgi:type I restriction enzyme S subunit